jgi:toxin CcdB
MAQFTLHRNRNRRTAQRIPYLLDVQSDLLADLATRVVVPVFRRSDTLRNSVSRLTPEITIDGEPCLLMTAQISGIAVGELGPAVGNLAAHRDEIIGAVDFLVTGF